MTEWLVPLCPVAVEVSEVGPVPYLVKPLTRRAFRRAEWPMVLNRLVSAVTLPYVKFVARQKPLQGEVRLIRRFDASFDRLWARLAPRFDAATASSV